MMYLPIIRKFNWSYQNITFLKERILFWNFNFFLSHIDMDIQPLDFETHNLRKGYNMYWQKTWVEAARDHLGKDAGEAKDSVHPWRPHAPSATFEVHLNTRHFYGNNIIKCKLINENYMQYISHIHAD